MTSQKASADDVEHISSTAVPGHQSLDHYPPPDRPNACSSFSHGPTSTPESDCNLVTALMSPKKPRPTPDTTDERTRRTVFYGRDGLAAYTTDPTSFPPSRVLYHNDKFVVINDLFPKASIHLLILPRDTHRNVMAPQDAFDDAQFLADCRQEEKKVRGIVASELRRRFGHASATDRPRLEAMDAEEPPDELPAGRDWDKEVISGIHANPSMNHVHIHVLSRDMVSEPMKKRNHYQSFTTDFLVALDQFPLAPDDYRRRYGYFPDDMICWRCGKNFQNRMTKLKEHLQEEFEEWKRE